MVHAAAAMGAALRAAARRCARRCGPRLAAPPPDGPRDRPAVWSGRASIASPDDVFWLTQDEVETAARATGRESTRSDYRRAGGLRAAGDLGPRAEGNAAGGVADQGRRALLRDRLERWMPARTDQAAGDTIKGIGASPGRVSGVARVIRRPR